MAENRLLTTKQAADYCSLSISAIKEWLRVGIVKRVRMPAVGRPGRPLRKVLIDRHQLDELIDSCKEEYDRY